MNISNSHKKALTFALLFMFVTLFAASWYVRETESDYILSTKLKISELETSLASTALLADRDGADLVVEDLIKDCSVENRERFDMLLGKLSQLKGQELDEMEQLFNACGNFYAVRKAVMVARLEREYEVYLDFIEILSLVDPKVKDITYNTKGWGDLVALEVKQSKLSTKLVDLQGKIIKALRQNITINSDEMQSMLAEGQETKDSLIVLGVQIDTQRREILNL